MYSYKPGWGVPDHPAIQQLERFGEPQERNYDDPTCDEDAIYEERRDGVFCGYDG